MCFNMTSVCAKMTGGSKSLSENSRQCQAIASDGNCELEHGAFSEDCAFDVSVEASYNLVPHNSYYKPHHANDAVGEDVLGVLGMHWKPGSLLVRTGGFPTKLQCAEFIMARGQRTVLHTTCKVPRRDRRQADAFL